jgi:hypothetical protein
MILVPCGRFLQLRRNVFNTGRSFRQSRPAFNFAAQQSGLARRREQGRSAVLWPTVSIGKLFAAKVAGAEWSARLSWTGACRHAIDQPMIQAILPREKRKGGTGSLLRAEPTKIVGRA